MYIFMYTYISYVAASFTTLPVVYILPEIQCPAFKSAGYTALYTRVHDSCTLHRELNLWCRSDPSEGKKNYFSA